MGIRESLVERRRKIGLELEAVQNTDRGDPAAYKLSLYAELESIERLLASPTLDQTASDTEGPFEVETSGLT